MALREDNGSDPSAVTSVTPEKTLPGLNGRKMPRQARAAGQAGGPDKVRPGRTAPQRTPHTYTHAHTQRDRDRRNLTRTGFVCL